MRLLLLFSCLCKLVAYAETPYMRLGAAAGDYLLRTYVRADAALRRERCLSACPKIVAGGKICCFCWRIRAEDGSGGRAAANGDGWRGDLAWRAYAAVSFSPSCLLVGVFLCFILGNSPLALWEFAEHHSMPSPAWTC